MSKKNLCTIKGSTDQLREWVTSSKIFKYIYIRYCTWDSTQKIMG